jgi:predicted lipoprotein with Yx(FWY)xxD motif
MRQVKYILLAAAVLAAVVVMTACGSGYGSGSGARGDAATVKVGSSDLGRVLVDAKGRTLYLWAHDTGSKSTCSGECADYWPPLIAHGMPSASAGAQAGLLGTSRRTDGSRQVTYAGHPLYYFVKDTEPGQTNGEGLTGFGGRWDPVSASGDAVQAASPMAAGSYSAASIEPASYTIPPLRARVFSPRPGARAGVGGTFSVDVALEARTRLANRFLAGYTSHFIDPNSPEFHPGTNASAPGLVVRLSTTPTIAGTPLRGPRTNLAGVFQINDITRLMGRKRSFNSWIVGVPGFFGRGTQATLTVYAVRGNAPAVVTGDEEPISNIVRERFTIAN